MPVDVELVRRRVLEAEACIAELKRLAGIPFAELSRDQVYSMRYNIIVLVESVVSLAVHVLVEDYGYAPEYYVEAVGELARRLGLRGGCVEELKALVRLRNLLVHRYWAIDDKRIYENVRRDFKCVESLLREVRVRYGGDKVLHGEPRGDRGEA